MKRQALAGLMLAATLLVGCGPAFGPKAANGVTFYCPGAGNSDFGDAGVREGLERAGYDGEVAAILWTISFNVAIDQALKFNAHLGGSKLASYIREYKRQYPDGAINIVGLSAGTGVAVWALEELDGKIKVDNVVLLGSSLSHKYDVSKALRSVSGKIYCYYSPNDAILAGPMKVFGTIDGVFLTEGAGSVGLQPPPSGKDRVINVRWRPEFQQYGYAGGHTDSTSAPFVRQYLSKHLLTPGDGGSLRIDTANSAGSDSRLAHLD
ncbi:hypothetical protein RAS1_29170 [Phycisphaerae bacterium RAS1]|nr:hypothetical protein RAS1_29170 [Phycisphaerae bacterium RAS1]